MVRSGPSRLELIFLAAFLGVVVLLVGLAFDRVAVERSRTVPGVVDGFFGFISEMGKSQWELFPAGILVLILLAGCWTIVPPMVRVFWAQFGAFAFFLFASIGGAGIFVNIVKQFIGRGRPMTFELFGPFTLEPFRFVYDFQSFPSGHSATGGALIAFGFLVLRRWRRQNEASDYGQPTASTTRWRISTLPSERLPVAGVGRARWLAELMRVKAGECAEFEIGAPDGKGRIDLLPTARDGADQTARWRSLAG